MLTENAVTKKVPVEWKIQSLTEVVNDNVPYFRYLVEHLGTDDGNKLISTYIEEVRKELEALRKEYPSGVVRRDVEMGEFRGGLRLWPFLSRTHNVTNPTDPVNLIFWRYGSSAIVEGILEKNVGGGWARTSIGSTLYALIDDTDHGGNASWKKMDSQLRKGSWLGISTHIRIYDGSRLCTHGKNAYSIAGAHEEAFTGIPPHTPTAWDAARDTVSNDLASIPSLLNSRSSVLLMAAGSRQGINYNGYASALEITVPAWLSLPAIP